MKKNRVFIVEDEKLVAIDVKSELESHGYEVAGICGNSEKVVEMIVDSRPDIVLMDVHLEGSKDGIDLASVIMEHYDVPVIYMTSYSDAETMQRSKETHPYGYILKPFDYRTVVFTIEMALSRHYFEKRYRESTLLLQTVFNAMSSAVFCIEQNGAISLFNVAAQNLFGFSDNEFSESIFPDFFEICDYPGSMPSINDFFTKCCTGSEFYSEEMTIAVKGKKHYVSVDISPVISGDGSVLRHVVMITDVTGRKNEEKEKIRTQKLESLSVLAGGIAHDFNNLLTSIIGNVSFLKISSSRDLSDPGNLMMVGDIEKAALRAQRLTQQLQTFSRGSSSVMKVTDIRELILDVSGFALSGSNIQCATDIAEDLYPVEIDESQISQVLQNLLLNAVQVMTAGGEIAVAAKNISLDDQNEYRLPEGAYIMVSVKDHGSGIKKDILPKIFDPYFTTKTNGSGMGLASSFSIIQDHSGYIGVNSKEGKGAEFFFLLPKSEKMIETLSEKKDIFSGKGIVLFIDNEESIRNTAGKILNALGFTSFVFDRFENLFKKYSALMLRNEKVYAVILDYTLPGERNILDLVQRLKKMDPDAKVIISSGYTDDTVITDYAKYGFSAFLAKPYTVEHISNVLKLIK